MAAPAHLLAVYDMDKTITRAPTYTPFLVHAAHALAPWRVALLPLAGLAALAFKAGLIGRGRVKQVAHRLVIGPRLSAAQADRLARDFAAAWVPARLRPGALARIERDRVEGRMLVMATASYGFYAEAIAVALGFDAVIATRAARDGEGTILPRIDGANCYGADKLAMVEAWLAGQGIARDDAHIRLYSDHVSDAPCLEMADQGVAVNPHAPLRALAGERGWAVEMW